jgi:hypothetical protein
MPSAAIVRRSSAQSLFIGLRAARANFWPGLFVQFLMLAAVLAYYRAPWMRPWFDWLAAMKREYGYGFSIAAAIIAGAVLPEALKIVFFQRGRPARSNAREFLFAAPVWGFLGFCVDTLYRSQAQWFGNDLSVMTLVKKVMVDQFIYNPFFAAPFTVACYEWKNHGFSRRAFEGMFTARFYGEKVLPTLIATWGVWIPLVSLIYSLPPLLQTPLFSLALSFWVLLAAYMNSARPEEMARGVESGPSGDYPPR